MRKTFASPAFATLIALAAAALQFGTWEINQARKAEATQVAWEVSIESRLTRLETKMDQLLAVTDAAIKIARDRLPKTREK